MREDCGGKKEREREREGGKNRGRGERKEREVGGEGKNSASTLYSTISELQVVKPPTHDMALNLSSSAHPGGPSLAPGQFAGVCTELDGIGMSLDILGR